MSTRSRRRSTSTLIQDPIHDRVDSLTQWAAACQAVVRQAWAAVPKERKQVLKASLEIYSRVPEDLPMEVVEQIVARAGLELPMRPGLTAEQRHALHAREQREQAAAAAHAAPETARKPTRPSRSRSIPGTPTPAQLPLSA